MEYIILDKSPIINQITTSNFVNIIDMNSDSCNVTISNIEASIHNVTIKNNDIVTSVNDYFLAISDKE
jgi:hypothetical protein